MMPKGRYVPGDVLEETVTNTMSCETCDNDVSFEIEEGEELPALVYCWRCGAEIVLIRIVDTRELDGKYTLDDVLGGFK